MTRFRTGGRWLALGAACAALVAVGSGCNQRTPPTGGATNPKAQAARTQSEAYALDAVKGAAVAQERYAANPSAAGHHEPVEKATKVSTPVAPVAPTAPVVPTPPSTPVATRPGPRPNVVIKERIATDVPFPTEAAADEEAIRMAQERIAARLQELDPPIRYTPSQHVVKNEYLRKENRTVRRPGPSEQEGWQQHGFTGDQVYVEYDVEVTAEQIRDLRTQERLSGAVRAIIGLAVVAFAGFLFLRLDDWTKGYLTSWLAFVAAGLAGGVAAALLMI
jgi:hypothetical protein